MTVNVEGPYTTNDLKNAARPVGVELFKFDKTIAAAKIDQSKLDDAQKKQLEEGNICENSFSFEIPEKSFSKTGFYTIKVTYNEKDGAAQSIAFRTIELTPLDYDLDSSLIQSESLKD